MDDSRGSSSSASLKRRIRSSNCFSCCFRGCGGDAAALHPAGEVPRPSMLRSSSAWVRSKAQELPELKEKCRSFISRIGRPRGRLPREFKYDPLSYALNFDDGPDFDDDGEPSPIDHRYRSFSVTASSDASAAGRPPDPGRGSPPVTSPRHPPFSVM